MSILHWLRLHELNMVASCMATKLMAVGSAVVSDNDATSLHLRTIHF